LKRVDPCDIPASTDLLSSEELERRLDARNEAPFSLVAVGDIMLGGRLRKVLAEHGDDYPFASTLPLLRRAEVLIGNLEGPLARVAARQERNFSYRVAPRHAWTLARAGFRGLTLANNHLLDCGRSGVVETLAALERAGVTALGAGRSRTEAHAPGVFEAGGCLIGVLAYYWNRRTSATSRLPGSAMDSRDELETDLRGLRGLVDRLVVFFHWGLPYLREPAQEDRDKARFAVECGADVVVGHHPHIVQPFEIWKGRPIFYSVGNFAFGSGNSLAESLLLGVRFEAGWTRVLIHPLYVKNRDPRVHYQPRALKDAAAGRILDRLRGWSGPDGDAIRLEADRGVLELPYLR